MSAKLSAEIKQAFANLPVGQPLSVENDEYVIVRRDVFEKLQRTIEYDDSEPNPRDFYAAFVKAVGDDIDAPGMEAYDDYDAHRAKS